MADSFETSASVYRGIPVAQVIPLKATRKLIADHMIQSHLTSARVTSLHEIDATELVALREELARDPQKTGGVKISYTHLLTKAVAQTLRQHQILNSVLVEKEILIFRDINIGVAMSLPDGNLIVPVIHQADQKKILEIARRTRELEERAQKGKLTVGDVQKGTFTLSNVGMLPEARWFTPIINQGQCAIFGTGAIRQVPAVRDGQIVIRWVITTSMTYDHRILNNGIYIEYFIQTLAQLLQNPALMELGL
jgi:pyruvate/2-oxoglutarate dehydrogenase complex dihydrolipoamide acyltransferase (E2) component